MTRSTSHRLQPALVYLSGSRRGTTQPILDQPIVLGPSGAAVVRRSGDDYQLTADSLAEVWLNGQRIQESPLQNGDVIELGRGGPVVRFRIYPSRYKLHKTLPQVFSDCIDCARYEGDSFFKRIGILMGGIPTELATQTSWVFRIVVLVSIVALTATTWSLARRSDNLEQRLLAEQQRIGGLSALLERTESKAVGDEALTQARSEFEQRLGALERRSDAEQRVVSGAAPAVIYLQGAYSFYDQKSGRPLRFSGVKQGGEIITDSTGNPATSLDGNGPVVEIRLTGTGFVVDNGLVVTNRHVALPWEYDDDAQQVLKQGLRAKTTRFLGYLPGIQEPFEVALISASENADVAILRCEAVTDQPSMLRLSESGPELGDGVIVLGYPTGVRALLARADRAFVDQLRKKKSLDFWSIADALSLGGHIGPLASRGIVSQVSSAKVVYDAETTSGGSGGPVLDLSGEVVAVNAAIIPEFGGSNLGVPAAFAQELLDAIDATTPTGPDL